MAASNELDAFVGQIDRTLHDPEARFREPQSSLADTLREIRFHAANRYWQFTPTYGSDFEARLLRWLNNPGLDRDDRATLLRLVPELQFIDRDDMFALYRAAFTHQIVPWLFDQLDLDFTLSESELRRALAVGLKHTWVCPVTDSMDISQFCHINSLKSSYRPQWRTLRRFGSVARIRAFLKDGELKRIVLLEDFVGSGKQVHEVLAFAMRHLPRTMPLLFVPLVVSPVGLSRLRRWRRRHRRLDIRPTLTIPSVVHVGEEPVPHEAPFVRHARNVIDKVKTQHRSNPYGFSGVGTLLLSYTNCPNNTPPLLWKDTKKWAALFPRVPRVRRST